MSFLHLPFQLAALSLINDAFSEGNVCTVHSSATKSPPSPLANSYARYDPSKGYYWEFPDDKPAGGHMDTASGFLLILFLPSLLLAADKDQKKPGTDEEPREAQRKKVDNLLTELVKKFPPKAFAGKVHTPHLMCM